MSNRERQHCMPLEASIMDQIKMYVQIQRANNVDIRNNPEKLQFLAQFKAFPTWLPQTQLFDDFLHADRDPSIHYIVKGFEDKNTYFIGGKGNQLHFYMPEITCSSFAARQIPLSNSPIPTSLGELGVFCEFDGMGLYEYTSGNPCEYVLLGMYGMYVNDPFHVNITPYLGDLTSGNLT